jgi:putative ABC transport system permease protein
VQDLTYALRLLRRSPGYALAAITTLALGIGANTAIFSIVDASVLRPLPYRNAGRLVTFALTNGPRRSTGVAAIDFLDWRDQQDVFDQIAVTGGRSVTLRIGTEPEELRVTRASAGFFDVYGVVPAFGRVFVRGDEQPGDDRKAVITDEFWRARLAADPLVVGRALALDDARYEIIGVLPASFRFPASNSRTDVFIPVTFDATDRQHGVVQSMGLACVARLKSGVTIDEAAIRMSALETRLDAQKTGFFKGYTHVELMPLLDQYVKSARPWMLLLLGAVGLVLLIACANVANLVIAHSSTRVRELAVRAAIGASHGRLARQLLTESVVLSIAGAGAGIVLAYGSLRLLDGAWPSSIPRGWSIGIDLRVLMFTAIVACATGVLCGLLPALRGFRLNLVSGLKEGSGATADPRRHRVRQALACVELSLAVMLLVGAGLFLASFARLLAVDRGFDGANVATVEVSPPKSLPRGAASLAYFRDMQSALARVPAVEQVAVAQEGGPLAAGYSTYPLTIVGQPAPSSGSPLQIRVRLFGASVFSVLRVPIMRGRVWTERDTAATPLVAVVNQAAVKQFWPDRDPIGERIVLHNQTYEVVGVTADVRYSSLVESPAPEADLSFEQGAPSYATFLVRTKPGVGGLAAAVKTAVWSVDSNRPVQFATVDDNYRDSTASRRFNTGLMGAFGLVGLGVAATGVYGVMSFLVAIRRHEMAVRLALGAGPRQLVRLIVAQSAGMIAIGVAAGLVGAWWASGAAGAFLFEIQPRNPFVFAASAAVLAIVAVLASWLPARRAGRIDPLTALKAE